jgi:hypothetical protein
MKTAIVTALLLAALPARALDPWTWQDTAWEAGFAAVVAIDIGQTRYALDRGRYEMNPILGRHPSQVRLVGLAASSIALHAGVSALLPESWRRPWQAVTVGLELGAVGMNGAHVGFRVAF